MSGRIDIGTLGSIPVRGVRLVKTSRGSIAGFRLSADRALALDHNCPHKGEPLSQGIVHGNEVTGPRHNWVINLETGIAQGAEERRVATAPLRIERRRILQRPDASGMAGSEAEVSCKV